MKIPENIKDSIKKSAMHMAIAKEHNEKILDWLDRQHLEVEQYEYIIEQLIDCIEINKPNSLIEVIEFDRFM